MFAGVSSSSRATCPIPRCVDGIGDGTVKSERSVVVLHHRSYHSTTRLLLHVCFLYYKLLFIFNSAYRLVFKMYPSLSHCFTVFHYHQLIVTRFLYTAQLLVHCVPCCTLPDCCKLHIVHTAFVFRTAG